MLRRPSILPTAAPDSAAVAPRAVPDPTRRDPCARRGRRGYLAGIVTLAVTTALALAGCSSSDQVSENEAARVNGSPIALDRVERAARALELQQAGSGQAVDAATASRQALQSLIQQQIVLDGAKTEGIEVADADVDGQIKQYEQQAAASNQNLDDALRQQGMTRDDLRERARIDVAVQRLGSKLVPGKSDAELNAEVQARRGDFLQVQARHVLVKDEAAAKKVRNQLASGGDWNSVAKQSQDPGSKDKGGELGFISKGQTVPEFEKSLYQLAEQGNCKGASGACQSPVSQPVKSQFGWHVLQVTAVRLPDIGQIRSQLEGQDLAQRRQTALQGWYKELLGTAKVVVNPRFGQWDAANGQIVDRETAPRPAPTPGATPSPAPQSTQNQ